MDDFQIFLLQNKDKIREVTETNTKRNECGFPVISKDEELEWD